MIRYLIFPLFLLGSLSSAFSQVRGIVKDIAGDPIIGANVFWLGTTTGTTTGESGKFSLPETGTSDKLVVRFVGYRSDTIHIDRVDTVWEIDLQDGAVMDEVQVSARRMGTMKIRSGILNQDMISTAELSRAACCNLGESFTTNPSVDVSYSDAATGAKQIKLLGLSGTYVQIIGVLLLLMHWATFPVRGCRVFKSRRALRRLKTAMNRLPAKSMWNLKSHRQPSRFRPICLPIR